MKYFLLTLKHKWFVLLAGLRIGGVPLWRLLIHDWSKFTPSELPHYQRQFFGKADDSLGFVRAWIHHQNHNPHHWEYWVPRSGHSRGTPIWNDNEPVPMPEWAVCEMVADWMAAGRAYEGKWPDKNDWVWLRKNIDRMVLHDYTKSTLAAVLSKRVGIDLVHDPDRGGDYVNRPDKPFRVFICPACAGDGWNIPGAAECVECWSTGRRLQARNPKTVEAT